MHALGCRLERAEAWRLTFFLYGSCEDCAGIRGAPDAAVGIAGAAWLEAMQAEEAIEARKKRFLA
jgi:hypothetical protein